MQISDLNQLADDEKIEETMELDIGPLTERQGKKGPFWTAKASDGTGSCNITFFCKYGANLGDTSVRIGPGEKGGGFVKGSYQGYNQLTVFQSAKVDIIQGGRAPAQANTSNMTPVEGQRSDGKDFHHRMRKVALLYCHCVDYAMEIKERTPNMDWTHETLKDLSTTLFIDAKREGLDAMKAPRLADVRAEKDRKEVAATVEAESKAPEPPEAEELEEQEIPF